MREDTSDEKDYEWEMSGIKLNLDENVNDEWHEKGQGYEVNDTKKEYN